MQLRLGDTKVKALMIHNDTSDATLKASDMQAGVTGYANGQKITGTGKAFVFAMYGAFSSKETIPIPVDEINTVSVSSATNPVKMIDAIDILRDLDFSTAQEVATITVDGTDYAISLQVASSMATFSCDQDVVLQILIGKDEYI